MENQIFEQSNFCISHENIENRIKMKSEWDREDDMKSVKNQCITNKKIYLFGAFFGVCVTIALVVLVRTMKNDIQTFSPNLQDENLAVHTPIVTDIGSVLLLSKTLRMISRLEWIAQPPSGPVENQTHAVSNVIIAHTATENCTDQAACTFHVRYIQTFHIESRHWSDIGYNFLVGGDGSAYEGRGWGKVGAHTKGYNVDSVGIAFIGTFNNILPPQRQLVACRQLIELGVAKGYIEKDYKLYGHRQLIPSLSPGNALFEEIKKWSHFHNKTSLQ